MRDMKLIFKQASALFGRGHCIVFLEAAVFSRFSAFPYKWQLDLALLKGAV